MTSAGRSELMRSLFISISSDETQAADREVDLAFTDQERLELADIGLALQRLDGDDYGLCVDCGEAIAFERLRVQPQALRCIGCEQARETRAGGAARHATL